MCLGRHQQTPRATNYTVMAFSTRTSTVPRSFPDTQPDRTHHLYLRVSAYDSAGNESWHRASLASATTLDTATVLFGTAANDYARGVALDSSGNIYVTGWTAGALNGQANPNGADIFLTKYNASGVHQWTRLLGTTGCN